MDDLLLAAAEHSITEAEARIALILEKYQGIEALRRVAWESLPLNDERADLWKMWVSFWDMSRPSAKIKTALDGHVARHKRCYRSLILAAQEREEVSADIDPSYAADGFLIFVHGIGLMSALNSASISAKRQRALLDDWIETMLHPVE
jgi:hypothetical protein